MEDTFWSGNIFSTQRPEKTEAVKLAFPRSQNKKFYKLAKQLESIRLDSRPEIMICIFERTI